MPRPEQPDEPLLFDLPLGGAERAAPPPPAPRRAARPEPSRKAAPPPEVPDFEDEPPAALAETADADELDGEEAAAARSGNGAVSRIASGAADLLVHAAMAVLLLVGTRMMGVHPLPSDWPALAVFLLAFSFLYMVVPLAFWGHTLGMAWAGLVSRNQDGEPLTFDQTARRWLGGLLTLGLLGLPLLVTGSRRSLSDLLSGSATYSSR